MSGASLSRVGGVCVHLQSGASKRSLRSRPDSSLRPRSCELGSAPSPRSHSAAALSYHAARAARLLWPAPIRHIEVDGTQNGCIASEPEVSDWFTNPTGHVSCD